MLYCDAGLPQSAGPYAEASEALEKWIRNGCTPGSGFRFTGGGTRGENNPCAGRNEKTERGIGRRSGSRGKIRRGSRVPRDGRRGGVGFCGAEESGRGRGRNGPRILRAGRRREDGSGSPHRNSAARGNQARAHHVRSPERRVFRQDGGGTGTRGTSRRQTFPGEHNGNIVRRQNAVLTETITDGAPEQSGA